MGRPEGVRHQMERTTTTTWLMPNEFINFAHSSQQSSEQKRTKKTREFSFLERQAVLKTMGKSMAFDCDADGCTLFHVDVA
jgi:hypothetical protein